jgi:hypothetical protein
MAYFVARNVTVHTYHAKETSFPDPIAAHRLKYVLNFAFQLGLDGITRHPSTTADGSVLIWILLIGTPKLLL